jgi:Uncharacterised nucleotidyltransferase
MLSPAERQILLISASVEAFREGIGGDFRKLLAEVNWHRLAEMLRRRKLLPILGPRIIALGAGAVPEEFAAGVAQALEVGRRQGTFIQLVTLRVMAMLADAGIRSTPLKGPLLGEMIYGDPSRRLSGDIDLLVASEQLQAAVEVVRKLDYDAPNDYVENDGLPLLHFALVHCRGELPPVELHWRVHWHERDFARERLLPPAPDGRGAWRPEPIDQLAALLLFYARDGFIDLRGATDVSAWWDVFGADLRDGALGDFLGVYPALTRVITVAAEVAERIVGLPAPRLLGHRPELDIRERLAARLANPNPHTTQSQLYAEKGLIDGLLTPSGELAGFVRRELLPPLEVRHGQAEHAGRQRVRSPVGRASSRLARYAWTMTRLLRAPETLPETQ